MFGTCKNKEKPYDKIMREPIEVEAKTVEEAIEKALGIK